MLPKDLNQLSSVFRDVALCDVPKYWFSYTNRGGNVANVFRDGVMLSKVKINFFDVEKIVLIVPSVHTASGCAVQLFGSFGKMIIEVDTASKPPFLDVFPIYRAIARQHHINARAQDNSAGTRV